MDDGGISRLQRRLNAIPAAVRQAVQPSLDKNSNELANLMKRLAPDDPETKGDDLRSSIHVEQGKHELSRAVVADAEHTLHVEFGTSKMDAQPFFYPAKRLLAKKIKRSLKSAVSRAVKKEWGK